MPVGGHQNAEPQMDPAGDRRQVGRSGNRFEDGLVGTQREGAVGPVGVAGVGGGGQRQMVAQEHAVQPQLVGAPSQRNQCVRDG